MPWLSNPALRQEGLFGRGPGLVVLNMGAGRDSLAMLCRLTTEGLTAKGRRLQPADLDAVVFSDPGAEWPHTYDIVPRIARICAENNLRFLVLQKPPAEVYEPWVEEQRQARLAARARGEPYRAPEVPWAYTGTTIDERAELGGYHLRPPIQDDFGSKETIAVRSDASCTAHHKVYPIRRLLEDLAKERFGAWASNGAWGRAVERGERAPHLNLVGFAADEEDRWGAAEAGGCFSVGYAEEAYPLVEDGIKKADEGPILAQCGLEDARKSGCWLCPHQPLGWFWALRETEPDTWAVVVEYERRAIARSGLKMAISGKLPIADQVERWRARNPYATPAEVLSKTYAKCKTVHASELMAANPWEACSLEDRRAAEAWVGLGLETWAARMRAGGRRRRNDGRGAPPVGLRVEALASLARRSRELELAAWFTREADTIAQAWAHAAPPQRALHALPREDLAHAVAGLDALAERHYGARRALTEARDAQDNPRWWPESGHPVRDLLDGADVGLQGWIDRNMGNVGRFVVGFSGGKDSVALVLALLERGVPRSRIELWHHDVDGRARPFFDWPCTEAYCRAFADAFDLPLFFSWREGGFEREMLRVNAPTAAVVFEVPGASGNSREHALRRAGGDSHQVGTRRLFPQTTADLRTRWCSSALKIDVAARALANDPRFQQGIHVLLTGERAQESAARARYAQAEPHRTWSRTRRILQWRPVHRWPEADVWGIMERWRVNPHPAYRLGFGRVSCMTCIFGSNDQWATIQALNPDRLQRIAAYEREFGKTIHRKMGVEERAARGQSFLPPGSEALALASQRRMFEEPILVRTWSLPAGAYQETGGPT